MIQSSQKVYTITIPETPVSINALLRMHWAPRKKLIDRWHYMVWGLCNEARISPTKRCEIKAVIYFAQNRKRDLPNYIASLDKLVLDGLVRCGIIIDDDPLHINKFVVEFGVDKEKPRTEVSISSLG
jgi:Holliday junction resolvase RusA-like endonuclease